MCSLLKFVEIVHVLVLELCCTMSALFPLTPYFVAFDVQHCILHSERGPFLADIGEREWTDFYQEFVIQDVIASILHQQEWHCFCRTCAQSAYMCIVHGKHHVRVTVHFLIAPLDCDVC
jgi:hypothetical protein